MISMKIVIQDEKDYQKFLRRLFFYKSIFYSFVSFQLEGDSKYSLSVFQTALNLKSRRKRIEYLYDQACSMIDSKNKNLNLCGFVNGRCYVQRKKKQKECNGCCRLCIYQTNHGCPTQNLACKLFHCGEVKQRYSVCSFEDFPYLKLLSLKNQYVLKNDYFSLREDVLKDLYAYTLTFSCLRIFFRIFKNFLLKRGKVLFFLFPML